MILTGMDEQEDSGRVTGVAIIGLSGRFPGAAGLCEFWANLRAGRESITILSERRPLDAGDAVGRVPGAAYIDARGRLDDISGFDAAFFGMNVPAASAVDPQHRLFLECAWEAFEHAGYVGERVEGPVAVFAAAGRRPRDRAGDRDVLATLVSRKLNLTGPSIDVQTAGSSSLVAVHLACQSLLSGECDMALAGGAAVYSDQHPGSPGENLSSDGHCRPFDARAAGTVMASAVGCLVLKRLEDATRDGDRVLAIIRGSAINNSGAREFGDQAAALAGQVRVVGEALAVAGVQPEEVSYVEAHGSGSPSGDAVEIVALTKAFRAFTAQRQFCAVGSVKGNIGHAGDAAGIVGLIKVVLALQHREIPATLHFETPHPEAHFANSPFYVNATLRDWTVPPGRRRIAGVMALGEGGTNLHLLVEQAADPPATTPSRGHHMLVLSARSPTALETATSRLAAHLGGDNPAALADVAYTLLEGRKPLPYRRVVVAGNAAEAVRALDRAEASRVITDTFTGRQAPSVVWMFPGAEQYAGMGAGLYAGEPLYRQVLDEALSSLDPDLEPDVRRFVGPTDEPAASLRMDGPSRTLPALVAVEYAVGRLLQAWGITPAGTFGQGPGEYAAACLAGVFDIHQAMALAAFEGRLLESLDACTRPGANASATAQMDAIEARTDEFERYCRRMSFKAPTVPLVSNVTWGWIAGAEATDPVYWGRRLQRTSRVGDGMQTLLDLPNGVFIEIGPGRTLTRLLGQQPKAPRVMTPTFRRPDEADSDVALLLTAVGRLWAAGVPIDSQTLFSGERRRRVALPTYPFERLQCWRDSDPQPAARSAPGLAKRPDPADWFALPAWARSARPQRVSASPSSWLVLTDDSPLATDIAAELRGSGHHVTAVIPGSGFALIGPGCYSVHPGNRMDYEALAQALRKSGQRPQYVLHLWAMTPPATGDGTARHDETEAERHYRDGLARNFFSLVYVAQAIAADEPALHICCVSSQLQAVAPADEVDPEKAVLLGPCTVIPHEYPNVSCTSIDIDWPMTRSARNRLLDNLVRELHHRDDGEIALRGQYRWIRRYDPVRLPPAMPQEWVRPGGTYVITGGLGGFALSIAEHLAASGPVRLALIDRTPLTPDAPVDPGLAGHGSANEPAGLAAVQRLRAHGADVLTLVAGAGDREAMRRALTDVHERFGAIHGVFHAAGVLQEQIIALRDSSLDTPVLEANFKTALVLDEVLSEAPFSAEPPELFVLFSSVSAVLGIPGQVEYTAACIALDRLAHARNRRAEGRTLSINWGPWRDVGVLADLVRVQRLVGHRPDVPWHGARPRHPATVLVANEDGRSSVFRASLSRNSPWVVAARVSGEAVLPATALLEFVRAAFEHRPEPRAVEFRDVRFLAPVVVPSGDPRDLHIRIEHGSGGAFACYAESEREPFALGSVGYADAPAPRHVDIGAIRLRCPRPASASEMGAAQELANAGPRWNSVLGIELGVREALITLALPSVFEADLDTYHLHPALLEMATVAAQGMVSGFDSRSTVYVPLSYGRVLLRHRLPARLISHVRLCGDEAHGSSAFDATLYDEGGAEVAVIERFIMRRHERPAPGTGPAAATVGADLRRHPESPAEAALRLGITTAEGVDALDRILAADLDPQIIASAVPLEPWLERLRARANRSGGRSDGARADRSASLIAAPHLPLPLQVSVDDLERDLTAMWCDVLELGNVEAHEDFFDLGGHSLLAVRLFRRIRDTFVVDLPLATLFEAPTIAEMAAVLRDRIAGVGPPESRTPADNDTGARLIALPAWRSLVAVQRGSGHTPLFVVHGAGGNVLNIKDLARAMDPSQTVFGLQASGIDGVSAPGASIEQMAETYLNEILSVQPHGPYLLAGYSGGGVVAFEMARRLDAAGEPIGLLAFIDTFHPHMPLPHIDVFTRLGRLRHEGTSYLRDAFGRRRKSFRDDRDGRLIDKHLAAGEPIPLALRELYLIRNFSTAQSRYQPQPWPGRALLFRAEQIDYYYRAGGPAYSWDKTVLGGVEIIRIPGNHDSIMVGANAARIARRLGQAIDEVKAQGIRTAVNTGSAAPVRTRD